MYLLRTCVPVCAYVDHLWNYVCVVHVPLTYLRAPMSITCGITYVWCTCLLRTCVRLK